MFAYVLDTSEDLPRLAPLVGSAPHKTLLPLGDGPDGRSCECVHALPVAERPTWYRSTIGSWYVGVYGDKERASADLRRPRCSGQAFTLRDGCEWIIPTVLPAFGRAMHIPLVPAISNGAIAFAPEPQYAPLVSEAAMLLKAAESGQAECDPVHIVRYCAALLGVNYHVGMDEVLLLNLLDSELCATIAHWSIDWPVRCAVG